MTRPKVLLSWSSGKDSAWSLHVLRDRGDVDVVGLLTSVNEVHQRVAMHAVREKLLQAQADAAGLPLWQVPIPSPCSNDQYEAAMARVVDRAKSEGIEQMAFGDLYLEDIRSYREGKLQGTGIEPIFPLWQIPTGELARDMIRGGLSAYLTCVDPRKVPRELAGRRFDESLLRELPEGVDPCGENGEFHSFVWKGPMLRRALDVEVGEVVERDGFVFADVLPRGTSQPERSEAVR